MYMSLHFVFIVMIIAGVLFFSSVIIFMILSIKLFERLKKAMPDYYAKKGSPDLPFGFEPISLARQINANKYLLSVLFGKAKAEVKDDAKSYQIIVSIKRVWLLVALPAWILWGAGVLYLSINYPNGVS